MAYFNIDYTKFKPSSKQSVNPTANPTVQTRLETNLNRLQPQQPVTPPTTPVAVEQPVVNQVPKTGMGKVFDALNKPSELTQSLLTGGKTYEESLGKMGVKNDVTKKVLGTAGRFVLDPLNFIPFGKIGGLIGKGLSKVDDVVKLSKFGDKLMDTARATPAIYKVAEKFSPYFRNPEFGKIMKESEGITSKRLNNLYDLIKSTAKNMSPEQQRKIGAVLEGGIDTSAKYEQLAAPLRELTEKIGKEAVDLGILSKKSFAKYKGVYMKHIFDKYVDVSKTQGFVKRVAPGIGQQFTKQRKGVEGYIREFSAPTFAGIGAGIKDIETAKFYKKIAADFGSAVEVVKKGRKIANRIVPEGFQYAPHAITNSKVAKFFKNKALPNSIIEYINKTAEVKRVNGWDKMLNAWKAGKTIYNPAYHVRNVISNQILSDMSTGRGLVKTVGDYVGAVKQYIGKGNQRFVDAARDIGIIKQKRFAESLDEFLETAKVVEKSKGAKVLDFPRKLQTVTEETSKLNVFKSWVEKLAKQAGMSVDEALKDSELLKRAADKAEEAIFSPYRLSQTERGLAANLIPFYSFTRQVVPFTAKTLLEHPSRIAKYGKAKREIESLSKDQTRPSYAENFVRLPFKNKSGEQAYFDPTYIYPFGNVFEGGERGKLPFGLGFNPVFTEVAQQMANKDFYFDQPITKYESEGMGAENLRSRVGHAARTAAPQFLSNVGSKVIPAITKKSDYTGKQRNLTQALVDTLLGIKTQFIGSQKGVLDQYYKSKAKTRSKQNDIKKIINDNSLTVEQKRKMLQKVLE